MQRRTGMETLENRNLLTAFSASLLKDISPGVLSTAVSQFYPAANHLYFTANDGQLWRTDGSTEGTAYLADVEPSRWLGVSEPSSPVSLFHVESGHIDYRRNFDLWGTDGSPEGTRLLLEDRSLKGSPIIVDTAWSLLPVIHGDDLELWRLDHTTLDLTKLTPIINGRWQVTSEFVVHEDHVFVSVFDTSTNNEDGTLSLIRTDGTVDGTAVISEKLTSAAVATESGLFYAARDANDDHQLFRITDAASRPEAVVPFQGEVRGLREYQGRLAFFVRAVDQAAEPESRRFLPGFTDGTPAGTFTLNVPATSSQAWSGETAHGLLYRNADATTVRTDGTNEGTRLLPSYGYELGWLDGRLYFYDGGFNWTPRVHSFTDGNAVFDAWTGEPLPPRDIPSTDTLASDTGLSPPPPPSWRLHEHYLEFYRRSSSNPNTPTFSFYYAPDENGVLHSVEASGLRDRQLHPVGDEFYLSTPTKLLQNASTMVAKSDRRDAGFADALRVLPSESAAELYFAFGGESQQTLWRLREGDVVDAIWPQHNDHSDEAPSLHVDVSPDAQPQFIEWHDKIFAIANTAETGSEIWVVEEQASEAVDLGLRSTDISDLAPWFRVAIADPQPNWEYSWDLNNDGKFGDASGADALLSWEQIDSLDPSIDKNVFRPYHVQATAPDGTLHSGTSLLRIKNDGPTLDSVNGLPSAAIEGDPIEFEVRATDSDSLTYGADFGDGTTIWKTSPNFAHTYSRMGIYTVRLFVRDTHGLQADWSREITVQSLDESANWLFLPGKAFGGTEATTDIATLHDPYTGVRQYFTAAADDVAQQFSANSVTPLTQTIDALAPHSNAVAVGNLTGDIVPEQIYATSDGLYDRFGRSSLLPAGTDGRDVAMGDLNGDLKTDVFVANYQDAEGHPAADTVLLNRAAGMHYAIDSGFRELKFASSVGVHRSTSVELADLNGDGHLDAAIAGPDGNRVYFNDGKANFASSEQSLGSGRHVAVGDLDGDQDVDLVVSRNGANSILMNDGKGNFTISDQQLGEANTAHAALGDMDGDGDIDIMFANGVGQATTLWLNDGHGVFEDSGARLSPDLNTTRIALIGVTPNASKPVAILANAGAPNQIYRTKPDVEPPRVVNIRSHIVDAHLQSFTIEFTEPVALNWIHFGVNGQDSVNAELEELQWFEPRNQVTWDVADLNANTGWHYVGISAKDAEGNEGSSGHSILVQRPGDFDQDFHVTLEDFKVVKRNYGLAVDDEDQGDADGNGIVNFADFLLVSANFGLT